MSDNIPFIRVPSSDFPSDILKWMKINAKPKMLLKLMKCCKYFQHFPEFPFFVVKEISFCYKDEGDEYEDHWWLMTLDDKTQIFKGLKSIERVTKKFWITKLLVFNVPEYLIPKIAVCDIRILHLDKPISYDDFKFLTASGNVKELNIWESIKYSNGDPVYIDKIFECVPKVTDIWFYSEMSVFDFDFINTLENIDASKLECFTLLTISFSHFLLFTKFMDKNPHVKYRLYFNDGSLSPEETKAIEKYMQRIIDAGITKYPPPDIGFLGRTNKQWFDLHKLSLDYFRTRIS
uniref:F-box domain-containing protein n=1 Tax=Panagrolaimus davidi TaxID=227884 RepID=A0A914QYN9_9BILA